MSVKIRLARHGAKKRPYYRIVVADTRSPRDGRFIEIVGRYNPMLAKDDEKRVELDIDKCKEWLGKGARPTERVARFLGAAGLWDFKPGNNPEKGKPGAKAMERVEERKEKEEARKAAEEEAKEAAKEAQKAAAEAAKAAAEEAKNAPAEEAKADNAPSEDSKAEDAKAEVAKADDAPAEDAKKDAKSEEE